MNYEAGMLDRQEQLGFEGEPARRGRRWLWIGLGAFVLVVIAGFLLMGRPATKPLPAAKGAKGQGQLLTVTVSAPGQQTASTIVTGTGSLAAKREMPVGVAGEGGLVTRVLVDAGSWVKKGQVLAVVDRSVQAQTAESLAAQIRVAEADAKLAQANLDRAQQLVGNGFISRADIDQRVATRDQALARVRVAKAQLAETQARNRRLDIRAPEAGLVLARQIEPGQIVSSGSGTLFRMAMDGQFELRTQLSEADVQKLHVGAPAEVTPVGTQTSFKGQVWQVSPVIDPTSRLGIARIALPYNPALRPGGFASARIVAGSVTSVILPQSAVQSDQQGTYVYILNDKNEAVRRDVKTGDVSDEGVRITSGLTGNERVVMTAGAFLNPGQKVIPQLQKK
ncbi:efflux RND transporter periplasmic adaptor subunit [Sphingomonas sp. ABOLD]|uniref:efflux RND transporter periplasmic adaptor subunit n=1 Tax=Sphingomonas sp. ABOLD TaxID=1985877 RepID=UPI000F7EA71E|nr:efflux RND transporter periplasmic adaptor subunit [Sphingomonas sp. ABOLD]RSV50360.1 efflux RND transporter periplasmic adaptor subunit [Sphingomonas sp. ABOLD]